MQKKHTMKIKVFVYKYFKIKYIYIIHFFYQNKIKKKEFIYPKIADGNTLHMEDIFTMN